MARINESPAVRPHGVCPLCGLDLPRATLRGHLGGVRCRDRAALLRRRETATTRALRAHLTAVEAAIDAATRASGRGHSSNRRMSSSR
jgi:hypothetical protein